MVYIWRHHSNEDMNIVHEYPINDLFKHTVDGSELCICGPSSKPIGKINGKFGWYILHYSLGKDED